MVIERKGVLLKGIYLPAKRRLFSLTFIWTFCHYSPEPSLFANIVQAFFHFPIFHSHTLNWRLCPEFGVTWNIQENYIIYRFHYTVFLVFIHEYFCLSAKETFVSFKEASRKSLLNTEEIAFSIFISIFYLIAIVGKTWLKWNYKINSFTISFENNIFSLVGFAAIKVSLIRIHLIDLISQIKCDTNDEPFSPSSAIISLNKWKALAIIHSA